MQQFTVPQFIDVEDKIIGPITVRQFVIILASCLIVVAVYRIFTFVAFIFISLVVFGIAAIFAFVRVNGMPFHFFILNFFQTVLRPNLRVWNHMLGRIETEFISGDDLKKNGNKIPKQDRRVGVSRLSELSLIVDTSGKFKGAEEQ